MKKKLILRLFSAFSPFSLFVQDGAAVHGPEGPCQCAMDCGARSGGKERSQHQVRDHYFLTYARHVHSCVCVCLSEVALYRGPAPESGTSDARRRVTSPAEKLKFNTPHFVPPSLAEPVNCMMTIGAAMFLFFLFPPIPGQASSSCLQGSHDL